jgi:hypothetical protein
MAQDLKMALDKCAREPIRSLSTVEAFKRLGVNVEGVAAGQAAGAGCGCSWLYMLALNSSVLV